MHDPPRHYGSMMIRAPDRIRLALALVLLCAAAALGCRPSPGDPLSPAASSDTNNTSVKVSVAASAQEALQEIAMHFERQEQQRVMVNAGPSSALANQLLNGAPVDLLLLASTEWSEAIVEAGRSAQVVPLLTNRLVLIVPEANSARVHEPADLAAERVKNVAIANESVPAGKYAEQALRSSGVYDRLSAGKKLVRGHDVRSTLSFVERGEADAGVVYATDANSSRHVRVVYEFPPASHEQVIYPLVLVKNGSDNRAAQSFFEVLQNEQSQAIFAKHGFQPFVRAAPVR